jgi:hypothetical protein
VQGEIAHLKGLDPRIQQAIEDAWNAGQDAADEALKRADVGELYTNVAAEQRGLESVRVLAKTTIGALDSSHNVILRTAQDVYRKVISETASQVLTGTMTRRQAAQVALNRFADKGVVSFTNARGATYDMASYAEMATRTATSSAAVEGHMGRLEETGHDLVIVTDSSEPCEMCMLWEGVVLSVSGNTPGYPAVDEAIADGLRHPNCCHGFDIWIEGVSEKPTLIPAEERQSNYKEREQQRYNERAIRKWKLREAVAMPGGSAVDDAGVASAHAKVSEWQGKQREFIADTDRRRDYGRESITKAR